MFDDSLAPTHEPEALFRYGLGSELVAPIQSGYLAEVDVGQLETLASMVSHSSRVDVRVAVSRIENIAALGTLEVMRGRLPETLWRSAIEVEDGARLFSLWLSPYADERARESVMSEIQVLQEQGLVRALSDSIVVTREPGSNSDQLRKNDAPSADSLSRATRVYRQSRFARLQLKVRDQAALQSLAASGAVYRIDSLRALVANEVPTAADPVRPVPDEQWQPIVGVIDGGLFAQSYDAMTAWRAPSLVSDVIANRAHGNRVASLVVHGGAWNKHVDLPDLTCRVGIAQAIAKDGQGTATRAEFVAYLRAVIERHSGDTKVWNLSFNQPVDGDEFLEMSELGHEIHNIARSFGVLPVISIGNVDGANAQRMAPPADCEAALTVGGRIIDGTQPGLACDSCLPGPGPEGLKKPELSWFSTLRGIGGAAHTGSSYAAAVTSAVAAHAFHNLKAPTPDLVRALLINTAERDEFDHRLGWGSPRVADALPWECTEGAVTLVWTSKLRAGQWYYWEDIPIPPELISSGLLRGRAALTAILSPMVSELGSANYFASRLQVALQYTKAKGQMGNLCGSMREDIANEQTARSDYAKWNPVRHHGKTFTRLGFSGNTLRVCARVFARDLYQFGLMNNSEIEPAEVAFALTLAAPPTEGATSSIYNSVAARLGAYVESAVNDVEISIHR